MPGVRQTNIVPKTKLLKVTPNLGPQHKGSFGKIKNREKTSLSSSVWKTGTATLNPIQQPAKSTGPTIKRLLNKIPGVL